MTTVSLIDVASYLPGSRCRRAFRAVRRIDELRGQPRCSGRRSTATTSPRTRRAVDMVERAAGRLLDRLGPDPLADVDMLLTNVPAARPCRSPAAAARVAHRLGCNPDWVLDLHNGGCVSFVYMMKSRARSCETGAAPHRADRDAQNAAGRSSTSPTVRARPQAAVPGRRLRRRPADGSDESPILDVECRYLRRVRRRHDRAVGPPRKYWEPGTGERLHRLHREQDRQDHRPRQPSRARGRLRGVRPIGRRPEDIDLLVTNQPNRSSCATGARRSSCPRSGTATPSTSTATSSAPAFRSPWTRPSPMARSRRATWC